jgi:hypothetical protein
MIRASGRLNIRAGSFLRLPGLKILPAGLEKMIDIGPTKMNAGISRGNTAKMEKGGPLMNMSTLIAKKGSDSRNLFASAFSANPISLMVYVLVLILRKFL